MRSKLFHLYFLLTRPMTLGVRAIVEDDRGYVLLVRHTYVKGWHLPGGGVERGQTMEQALAMELREEANIGEMGGVNLQAIYFNRRASKRDHIALYLVKNWSNKGEFVANREIAEIKFFPLMDLPPDVARATRSRLAEIYQGQAISKEW